MIFSGSRTWGEPRLGINDEGVLSGERSVLAQTINRLVGRWIIGMEKPTKARDRSLEKGPGLLVRQGGARGLDDQAARVARVVGEGLRRLGQAEFRKAYIEPRLAEGLWLETFPADWTGLGKAAGGLRNQQMLDAGADHVIAFFAHGSPYGPDLRGGTNDMIRRAVAAGITVDIYVAVERRWRKP